MKKSDNFNAIQWLTENKITTQSKLKENNKNNEFTALLSSLESDLKIYDGEEITYEDDDETMEITVSIYPSDRYKEITQAVNVILKKHPLFKIDKDTIDRYRDEDGVILTFDIIKKSNKDDMQIKENQIQGVDVEVDDDMVTLSGNSGDYDGFIEDNGTVSFSVVYDDVDEEFNDQNWKDILGDDHVFVKIANAINTEVEAMDDYVQITVKADDLTSMNESRLNENNTEASELLSLLASSEIKKYMDKLSDTLEDEDFMRVKKLYDGLYTELKKHE
jgi:hypothetical protein